MNIWQMLGWFVALPVGVSTLAGAVVVFLGRTLLSHLLSKDVEKFKIELEAVAFKDRTRFTTLHEKRAEIIAELYKKIFDAEMAIRRTTIDDIDDLVFGSHEARLKNASDLIHDVRMYHWRNKIYLEESLVEEIEKFTTELSNVYFTAAGIGTQKADLQKAFGKIENIIQPMKTSLETRFRHILGVLDL